MKAKTVARFWKKVNMTLFCWEWTSWRSPGGYGRLRSSTRTVAAHRFSWEIHFGPIPAGLDVLHKCDNRLCVNPAHLFLGTQADNNADMIAKGRNRSNPPRGEACKGAKLSEEAIIAIRKKSSDGQSLRSLSREFGVSYPTIRKICRGEKWKHVALVPAKEATNG